MSDQGNELPIKPPSREAPQPFKGEIVDRPNTGNIVVFTGYHKLEERWGEIVRQQFGQNVTDDGNKVVFHKLQDPRRADTGEDSPYAAAEIAEFMKGVGKVEMVIDVHEHPGAHATLVRNMWSLTTEDPEVKQQAKGAINDLRTLPFDDYSRRRTGGTSIPYAITDPDLPSGGVDAYFNGNVTPQMQEAINDSVAFITSLANIQLEVSAKK